MSNTPTNPTIITALTELGLVENDAKLYEVLLNTPDATISVLQQKSPFSRTMLYYVLNSLEEWGMLSKKEIGKKTVYNAEPPEKLEELVDNQEKELKRGKQLLGNVIHDLRSSYRLAHNKPGIKFFEGLEGIEAVTRDSLRATTTIYTYADMEAMDKYASDINKKYVEERIKKGVTKKMIVVDSPYTRKRYPRQPSERLLEVRFIGKGVAPFQTGVQIYDNTISYSTLSPDRHIGVIIDDSAIAWMNKSLFEYIWNTLPPFQAASANSVSDRVEETPGGRTNTA